MKYMSSMKTHDSKLKLESSKPIVDDETLEMIVMYMENTQGFNVAKYKKVGKYHVDMTLEEIDDKERFVEQYESGNLKPLTVNGLDLTLSAELDELIAKQDVSAQLDNRQLILFNLKQKYQNNREHLELLVDLITGDCEGCVFESIVPSKIFANCVNVKYTKDFDANLVAKKFEQSNQLKNSCDFMFCYKNLNFLLMSSEDVQRDIDYLKSVFQLKSVSVVENDLLLEFKNSDDLNTFTQSHFDRFKCEPVHNLNLLKDCVKQQQQEMSCSNIVCGEAKGKEDEASTWIELDQKYRIHIEDHPSLSVLEFSNWLVVDLNEKISNINGVNVNKCDLSENALTIEFICAPRVCDEVKSSIETFLSEIN